MTINKTSEQALIAETLEHQISALSLEDAKFLAEFAGYKVIGVYADGFLACNHSKDPDAIFRWNPYKNIGQAMECVKIIEESGYQVAIVRDTCRIYKDHVTNEIVFKCGDDKESAICNAAIEFYTSKTGVQ